MKLFISPHQDDEGLFGCYTILREKPLVLFATDSYIEFKRGDGVTAEERNEESRLACKLMGVECSFLGIPDDEITEQKLYDALGEIYDVDICYCPAFETGGNPIHNLVARVAPVFFDCVHYMTYTNDSTKTKGSVILTPTDKERAIKEVVLNCYPSQKRIPSTAPFFNHPEVLNWESYE